MPIISRLRNRIECDFRPIWHGPIFMLAGQGSDCGVGEGQEEISAKDHNENCRNAPKFALVDSHVLKADHPAFFLYRIFSDVRFDLVPVVRVFETLEV